MPAFSTTEAVLPLPEEVRIVVCFDYSRNTARFDGLQLHREQFSQSYSYDDNGNVTGYASLIGQEPKLTYDNNDNVTSSTDPLGNKTLYTYDSKHNLLTSTTPRRCENNQCLRCKRKCYKNFGCIVRWFAFDFVNNSIQCCLGARFRCY